MQSVCNTEGSSGAPAFTKFNNESTVMKAVSRADQENRLNDTGNSSVSRKHCPDFADIVSIVS